LLRRVLKTKHENNENKTKEEEQTNKETKKISEKNSEQVENTVSGG